VSERRPNVVFVFRDQWRGQAPGCGAYAALYLLRALDGPWFLYDNVADPYQPDNLTGRPEHAVLQMQVSRKLAERGDEFLPGARGYRDS